MHILFKDNKVIDWLIELIELYNKISSCVINNNNNKYSCKNNGHSGGKYRYEINKTNYYSIYMQNAYYNAGIYK